MDAFASLTGSDLLLVFIAGMMCGLVARLTRTR